MAQAQAAAKKRTTTASSRPVQGKRRGAMEPMEQKVGQDNPRDMPTTGPARIEPQEIEVVDGPNWKEKAAALAFMNEEITVMVLPTTEPNAALVIDLWNGGRSQFFVRNVPQTCKRKFVEVLARAKKTVFTQEHYKDNTGADAIRNVPHTALRYPFSVIHDPNPNGVEWLKKVLAEV